MKQPIKNLSILSLVSISLSLLTSCSTSTHQKGSVYNPDTEEVEHYNYGPLYQLKAELIPKNLVFTLVTQLEKKTLPGAYTIKEYTRRLLPNDYMAKSNTSIYLQNMSEQTINLDLITINLENHHLPLSRRNIILPAHDTVSVPLGEISIDLRLTTLNTKIEYLVSGSGIQEEHLEKEFDMPRKIIINKGK